MQLNASAKTFFLLCVLSTSACHLSAQIGIRFPSEKKIIKDSVTGTMLTFLTSTKSGDSKIYQTHNQWTSDGQWLIFRSNRVRGEAMAVNEQTGDIVQVTEGGYTGMLNVARKSMKLYFMRNEKTDSIAPTPGDTARRRIQRPVQIIEVDLEKLFADSKAGTLKKQNYYQRICGTTPKEIGAGGDMALDGDEEWVYFKVNTQEATKHLPSGISSMNIKTGEIKYVVSVPFQIGHIQTNPWVAGEIIFCWETGGKSPQRTWTVMNDGTGLRPLYPESEYEWVTHEAVISKDEVAIAIMGHRKIAGTNKNAEAGTPVSGANPGQEAAWGPSGTREKPTGLGIVNFARNIYLIDRHTNEMILLSAGHKTTAADHPHPTVSPDGTKIQIQSAMLSADNRSMNICIIPIPAEWLKRKYND
jgi:oligogalacturonide lyase